MFRTGEENDKKRARLIHMYEELLSILDTKDGSKRAEFVTDLLQTDNTSNDLLDDCDTKIEHLKQRECMILVAGTSFNLIIILYTDNSNLCNYWPASITYNQTFIFPL